MEGKSNRSDRRDLLRLAERTVFGDSIAVAIFFGALVFFGVTWRIGSLTAEVDAVANTLVAVADGQLHVDAVVYGSEASELDGDDVPRTGYGYGQVLLALPFLWVLQAATAIVDLNAVLGVAWSLAVVGFAASLGDLSGRRWLAIKVGGTIAAGLLVANLVLAHPLAQDRVYLAALQLSTMVAAALTGAVMYRLLRRIHGRTAGAFAGSLVVLATPVGIWATIPMRHTLVALFAVLAAYCLYRARTSGPGWTVRFRAMAYCCAGLTAWVYALDGMVLLAALASADLFTARSFDLRDGAVVSATFGLSLVPFLVTNVLVSGHPLQPPEPLSTPGVASGSGGSAVLASRVMGVDRFAEHLIQALGALTDAGRLFAVFGRSAFSRVEIAYVNLGPVPLKLRGVPMDVSVLEAMPLVGFLYAGPILLYRRVRRGGIRSGFGNDPKRVVDTFVLSYAVLLIVAYLPGLPSEGSITVRHLHPLYPLAAYLLVRVELVREAVCTEWRTLARFYGVATVGGGAAFVVLAGAATGIPDQAARLHAMLAFATGAALVYWGAAGSLTSGHRRSTALAVAFGGAVTTVFVLLASLAYLSYESRFALPVSQLLADLLVI